MALRIQQLEQGQQRIKVLMENPLLTLQRPPNNDEVPLQDEANGGENESRALTKKDVDISSPKQKKRIDSRSMEPSHHILYGWTRFRSLQSSNNLFSKHIRGKVQLDSMSSTSIQN
ncbi:hypothetical protein AAC387_Pa10g0608 [Persea americana]